ncbi:hypothetical protein K470DRAFT_255811 [Piedraia hortae CBS 480.64]|uniref:Uncharacterized protein n=1 Tax=Piedraia hortae CBS 480.64 TaxID=1314780 RepID=A0A6A7C4L1_9PEZI|nr:hypothetical protein K470DRAFT_255811 [Piedraia hortae CBS 480.64]
MDSQHMKHLRKLLKLQHLQFSDIGAEVRAGDLIDDDFMRLSKALGDLRNLNMSIYHCKQLTAKAIFTIGKSCRKLRSLMILLLVLTCAPRQSIARAHLYFPVRKVFISCTITRRHCFRGHT